ncbi:MAG: hypothetical protein L0H84_15160 [Pseudonocardia sp.]|nr:hypothetical protein [Pseudonocardia sp.]
MSPDLLPIERHDLTRILQQAIIWRSYSDHGRLTTHYIDDMSERHRRRVLAWLRAHADMLRDFHADHLTHRQKLGAIKLDQWSAQLAALDATTPAVWLDEQPLVRRLADLTPREPQPRRGLLHRWRWRR